MKVPGIHRTLLATVFLVLHFSWSQAGAQHPGRAGNSGMPPNIVIVVIDDMGYGDLTCHGSPHIRTPHLDKLHDTGVRLTDFHVAPMCSPTRGQLLTGRDALRNGSSIIASSRMMVRSGVPMMPELFAAAGYATGQFGKWHLGENYPHRPQDRGFQTALWFPLQEISSLSDHWENDYFDPVLRLQDGSSKRFKGFCTDIFFNQAMAWMRKQHHRKKPFLCYLPLNVCHGPQWVPTKYRKDVRDLFPELEPAQVNYLAMLANADANFGRLELFLKEIGLDQNTIVIFLSDNGAYALTGIYNAGMRGGKSRLTEGGHRVPCFVRWPGGGITGGRDLSGLSEVQDLLPTLLDLCRIPASNLAFDGLSLAKPLLGEEPSIQGRSLIVQYGEPQPFRMTCVMQDRWRLLSDIKGTALGDPELYNLSSDPLQKTNLVRVLPAKAASLRAIYDAWWANTEPLTRERSFVSIGHPAQPKVRLSCSEWRDQTISGVNVLREGAKRRGIWDVEVAREGLYQIALYRWPAESRLKLHDPAPPWTPRDTSNPNHPGFSAGTALPIASGHLRAGRNTHVLKAGPDDRAIVFRIPLTTGRTELEAWFSDFEGQPLSGAFFVEVNLRK